MTTGRYDVTAEETFRNVPKWKEDIDKKVSFPFTGADGCEEPIPCVLLANKVDLDSGAVSEATLNRFCREHNFIKWFATSAKDGTNVHEAAVFLARHIFEHAKDSRAPARDEDVLDMTRDLGGGVGGPGASRQQPKQGCCS